MGTIIKASKSTLEGNMMDIVDQLEAQSGTVHSAAYEVMREAKEEIERLREILQRAKPTVAWMTEDGRVAHASTKECMPGVSQESYSIPLCIKR